MMPCGAPEVQYHDDGLVERVRDIGAVGAGVMGGGAASRQTSSTAFPPSPLVTRDIGCDALKLCWRAKVKSFDKNLARDFNGLGLPQDMVETHPEKRLIGWARVSTYGQTLDSQLERLHAAGCGSRNIYREKETGARLTACSAS